MAFRDILRRLGLASRDSGRARSDVRRARLPQRCPDMPTVRVRSHGDLASLSPAAGADTPAPTEVAKSPPVFASDPPVAFAPLRPTPPAPAAGPRFAGGARPQQEPASQPETPPPASELGGQTQYFAIEQPSKRVPVGLLVATDGPLLGEVHKVHDGENRLGRENCEVILRSKRISRYHARVKHADGAFVVEANAEVMAKNPTFLNDNEIDAEVLSDGDVLRLGDTTLKFRTL